MILTICQLAIHELDFLKTGSSMLAKNARESIRFIDKFFSTEHVETLSELIIETPEEAGPSWKKCIKHKTRSPKVSEFEDSKTAKKTRNDNFQSNDVVKYETDLINEGGISKKEETVDQRAELPNRLKYLIRPCIKKINFDQEDWFLITEDSSTKIWCEAFNIKCVTLTEAESKLFHTKNKDVKGWESSPASRLKKSTKKDDNKDVVIERFNSVSYAPRGSGELWVP